MEKEIYHLEEAAIAGHPGTRYQLGTHEFNIGNIERAVKHWIISASTKWLLEAYREGFCSKEELTTVLRAHQAAADATKSPQKDLPTM